MKSIEVRSSKFTVLNFGSGFEMPISCCPWLGKHWIHTEHGFIQGTLLNDESTTDETDAKLIDLRKARARSFGTCWAQSFVP